MKKKYYGLNRATQSVRQAGSSFKPLSVIAPGIEEGVITASTVYNDVETDFGGDYIPSNYNGWKGLVSVRSFVSTSQNIPALKIMRELGTTTSIEYLNAMGIESINKEEDADLSLALRRNYKWCNTT